MDKKKLTKEEFQEYVSKMYLDMYTKYESEFKNAMTDAMIYGKGTIIYTNDGDIKHIPFEFKK